MTITTALRKKFTDQENLATHTYLHKVEPAFWDNIEDKFSERKPLEAKVTSNQNYLDSLKQLMLDQFLNNPKLFAANAIKIKIPLEIVFVFTRSRSSFYDVI
ncbi:hypothetical protein Tco_0299507 [Tanacetum coccineum]